MRKLSARWLVEMAEYISDNPQFIVNGFIRAGISESLDGCEDVILVENGDSNLQMESYQATAKTRSNTAHVDTFTGVTYPIIYILAHCTIINSVTSFIHCSSLLISFSLPMKSSVLGISSPPCGRSYEYCHVPETVHCIDAPSRTKREQI